MRYIAESFLLINFLLIIGIIFILSIVTLWRFDLNAFIVMSDFISNANNFHLIRKGFIIIESFILFIAVTSDKD